MGCPSGRDMWTSQCLNLVMFGAPDPSRIWGRHIKGTKMCEQFNVKLRLESWQNWGFEEFTMHLSTALNLLKWVQLNNMKNINLKKNVLNSKIVRLQHGAYLIMDTVTWTSFVNHVKDDGLSELCKVIRFRILDEWMHISCISWDVYGWMIILNWLNWY